MASLQQYSPLRTPRNWSFEERKLIVQLTDVFDDLYKRFNRIRFEDLGSVLRDRVADTENNVIEVRQTASELALMVSGGSTIYRQDEEPTEGMTYGDIWYQGDVCHRYEDGVWVVIPFTNTIDGLRNLASLILSADAIISTVISSAVFEAAMNGKVDNDDLEPYATTAYVNERDESVVTQTAQEITLAFNSEKTRAEAVEGEIKAFTDEAALRFVFDVTGLIIKSPDSTLSLKLKNDRIQFLDGTTEVAYISGNKLYITDAHVLNLLTIGKDSVTNGSEGFVDLDTVYSDSSGGLMAMWRAT